MAAHDDDLLGPHSFRSDYTAQTNGTVANYRDLFARPDFRHDRGMMACAHHVRERE
jgi:hypothetical protein